MYFTVEEENLICLYHNADRRRTAANLRAALPDMDKEMAALADDPTKPWTIDELKTRGEQVYAANCVACHQANGKGVPAAFAALETMFARYGFEVFNYSYLPETNDSQYVDGFHGSDRVYAALCARLAEDSLLLGAQFDSAALTALFTAQGNPLTVSLP